MSEDITNLIKNCTYCQVNRPAARHEPLQPTSLPDQPWSLIGADLLDFNGSQYLVVIDYYSRFIELAYMPSTTTLAVKSKLDSFFARWGDPVTLVTDNGPQFSSSEFEEFAKEHEFQHCTSSPHFPQANGQAERAVQVAKTILRQVNPMAALKVYRATPHSSTGFSPAQLMMGRNIRTSLPTLPSQTEPRWPDSQLVWINDDKAKQAYAAAYNKRHGVRPLKELEPGDRVVTRTDKEKTWSAPGRVVNRHEAPRSYVVERDDGAIYRRNRRHIRVVPKDTPVPQRQRQVIEHYAIPPVPPRLEPVGQPNAAPVRENRIAPGNPPGIDRNMTRSGRTVRPVQRMDL